MGSTRCRVPHHAILSRVGRLDVGHDAASPHSRHGELAPAFAAWRLQALPRSVARRQLPRQRQHPVLQQREEARLVTR